MARLRLLAFFFCLPMLLAMPAGAQTEAEEDPEFTPGEYRSLIFSREEMEHLNQAIEIYARGGLVATQGDLVAALQQPGAPVPTERVVKHPQYFLSAIVYRAPGDWAIWVNHVRYAPDALPESTEQGALRILSVGERRVEMEWLPAEMALYADRPVGEGAQRVAVDTSAGTMRFWLSPNQTFSAYSLSIVEGELPPVREETVTVQQHPPTPGDAHAAEQGSVPLQEVPAKPAPAAKPPASSSAVLPSVPTFSMGGGR